MTITSFCNYECVYCSKDHPKVFLEKKEILEILQAAYQSNVKRVHWTGGEPLCHPDFLDCVYEAKDMGFEEQIISTNGSFANFDKLCKSPINRFNISLDTLNEFLYTRLTNKNNLHLVLNNIKKTIDVNKMVKINCVVMKNNINEIPNMIEYFSKFNTKDQEKIILRLIQFYPSNPNQLDAEGRNYWANQYVSYDEILNKIGNYKPAQTIGDNPTFKYFELTDCPIKVGVLAMFSWHYICGGCQKLRVTPYGEASVCLADENTYRLKDLPLEEKIKMIQIAMKRREGLSPNRLHFNQCLGIFRFGSNGKKVSLLELSNSLSKSEN